MKRTVFIRTDANNRIASGHLVRCLSIGAALKKEGARVIFVLADRESQKVLDTMTSGQEALVSDEAAVLDSNYALPEEELPSLINLLKGESDPILLADSYFISRDYFAFLQQAKKDGKVPENLQAGYLDDLRRESLPLDFVINYEPDADKSQYPGIPLVLTGLSYAPLRPSFAGIQRQVHEQVGRILLLTGGSDPYGMLEDLTRQLLKEDWIREGNIRLEAVAGPLHPAVGTLKKLALEHPMLRLRQNVTDMAALMKNCDLAVTAGGTTLYELCAAGLPAVAFIMAKNQAAAVKGFARMGAVLLAGDLTEGGKGSALPPDQLPDGLKEKVIYNICKGLRSISSLQARTRLTEAAKTIVDGKGASRIAQALLDEQGNGN